MKKARLKVVGLKWPSIISFDSVLCQVTASAMRWSRGARLFLSRAATGPGSGVPSLGSSAPSIMASKSPVVAAAGNRSPISIS